MAVKWKNVEGLGYSYPMNAEGYVEGKVFKIMGEDELILRVEGVSFSTGITVNKLEKETSETKFREMTFSDHMTYSGSSKGSTIVEVEVPEEKLEELLDLLMEFSGTENDRDELLKVMKEDLDDGSGSYAITMINGAPDGSDEEYVPGSPIREPETFIELVPGYGGCIFIPDSTLSKESVLAIFQQGDYRSLFRLAEMTGTINL